METTVRYNERSWAIDIISEIKAMLKGMNLKIRSVGGESTISANKQSMFPDVLLYEDEAQNRILQGWELKMPDVLITDQALINDAARKANTLGLNSFVIWNFTYGKLYVNNNGAFEEAKVWSETSYIQSREDVNTFKDDWMPVIKDIVLTVNEFLIKGTILSSSIESTVSDGIMTELIQRNKSLVAEKLVTESGCNMAMESRLKVWWSSFREEYDKDESNMYSAYAKSILLNWTNRIMFANTIKKYHNCAYLIDEINRDSTPLEGNAIFNEIIERGDFYNVFRGMEYNDVIPEDTWVDIVDYNQFLVENRVESIDQTLLQEILERTVNTAKREIRGQYATPYPLANLLCQITINNWREECADLCAGTGTIARAIINNKNERLHNAVTSFSTTWVADKYAYPLQIANIALTSVEALNIPLNIFQSDVFGVNSYKCVQIKSPVDGSEIDKTIPQFGAIVSNLPFVKYNNIAADEVAYIEEYRQKIKDNTGIEFALGKADLYIYIPFKLHELLKMDGRLGIVLSNSWLGTNVGKAFFHALQFYFDIYSVVISNSGRWFKNADVVATLLVMQKKDVGEPNRDAQINFWMLNKELEQLDKDEIEAVVHSVVLAEEIKDAIASLKKYSMI